LLLRHAGNPVIAGVMDGNRPALLQDEPVRPIEDGITNATLTARTVRRAEIDRPPVARTGTPGTGRPVPQSREIRTQRGDAGLQVVVEHIADHDHAALHPLTGPAEFRQVEPGHGAAALPDGVEQRHGRVFTDAMTPRDLRDFAPVVSCRCLHPVPPEGSGGCVAPALC
jgi:hypothetical protein